MFAVSAELLNTPEDTQLKTTATAHGAVGLAPIAVHTRLRDKVAPRREAVLAGLQHQHLGIAIKLMCILRTRIGIISFVIGAATIIEMYLAGTDGYVDYYVTSGYTSYISFAANTWNSYTGDKLRDITPNYLIIPINADAYVSTVYVVTNEYAARVVWNSKQIELNKYWFDIYENGGNSSYCVNAITHEFGHALGIDYTVDTGDIMYWRTTPLTTLSNQDKKAYDVSCLRF